MDYHNIYKKVESFVTELYEKNQTEVLLFHTLKHTEKVVEHAKEIGAYYQLSEKDQFILYTAAWFHDTGHLFTTPAEHEAKSVEIMKEFLKKHIDDQQLIDEIEKTIMATKLPSNPQTLLQQIMCDADTYHLGTEEFKSTNKKIKKEYDRRKIKMPNKNWNENTLQFLQSHRYFTPYSNELLDKGKEENMQRLSKKMKKKDADVPVTDQLLQTEESKKGTVRQRNNLISKGIQTMLRLSSENHLKLSDMADHKASILISVNSIIISVILSVLIRRLDVDTYLTIPTIIFLACSVITIVIAIFATVPKVTQGVFSREDVINKKTNLMFFGNFYKTTYEEYKWGMGQMMQDPEYLYGALTKDIYHLGVVLGRKYRLISIAYYVFMVGIVISVIAFALAVIFNTHQAIPTNSSSQMPL